MVIAVDGGNTKLKIALVNLETLEVYSFKNTTFEDFPEAIAELLKQSNEESLPLGLTSVVKETELFVAEFSKDSPLISSYAFCNAKTIDSLTIQYNKATIGSDRIAAALAAQNLYPNQDCIVIDSGTATTVDALSAKGEFLGGFIIPGIGTKAQSLSEKTDKLPETDVYNISCSSMPQNTKEAIESGLIIDTLGGIEKAIKLLSKSLSNPTVIACGGGWDILLPFWDGIKVETVPALTILGAALTATFSKQ